MAKRLRQARVDKFVNTHDTNKVNRLASIYELRYLMPVMRIALNESISFETRLNTLVAHHNHIQQELHRPSVDKFEKELKTKNDNVDYQQIEDRLLLRYNCSLDQWALFADPEGSRW